MEFLTHLWLPILASAAAVWIASALAWMLVGHHKNDWKEVPNEQEFIDTIKRMGIPPGSYGFPEFRKCQGMDKQQKQAKWEEMQKNPMGLLRVWGKINMGRSMLLSFLVFLVVSVLVGYLGWMTLPHGGPSVGGVSVGGAARPEFGRVMQVLGTAGILAYCFASLPNDIWFQRGRREVLTNFIDGVVFGLITGAVFGWLWPK
jgi:hypothetical protein